MNFKDFPTYVAVISSYIGVYSSMFILYFASPTQKQLIEEGILDFTTLPMFASLPYFTKVIGYITTPILLQFGINLKIIVTIDALIGLFGYLLIISADSAATIIIGVSLVGFYGGILAVCMFTYVTEVAVCSQRKITSGGIGFCIRIGLFFTYFIGIWLCFRWLAVFGLVLVCLTSFLHLLNPLSPAWYVQQGLNDKAKSTLYYLHGNEFDADAEIDQIKNEILGSKVSWNESIKALKEWRVLKPILLMCVLGLLKELGGHEAMVSFSTRVLENQQALNPKVAALFYPIFLIAGAILCILILKYCKKMKWVLIIASIFQATSHMSMAVYYFVSENYLRCNTENSQLCHTLSLWPISNIALYAFSFGFGWGVLFFSLAGVIFTIHKDFSFGITNACVCFCAFIDVIVFIFLLRNLGGALTFLILSFNYIAAIAYIYFFINI